MRTVPRLVLLAFLALTACAPASPATLAPAPAVPSGTEREEKQSIRVVLGGMPVTMTPMHYATNPWLFWALYDNLTQFDANFEVKPSVAEKWELSSDGLKWTFTLRKDVKWPDGSALTAEDVAFSITQILERRWTLISFFATTTGARAAGENTLEVTTRTPDLSVPNGGAYLWIMPKKHWETVGGLDGFIAKPVGSGPYEIVDGSFRAGDSVTLRRRTTPHAFRRPANEELVYKAVADQGQTINGLRGGEVDITILRPFTAEQADQLKAANMAVLSYPVGNSSVRLPQGTYESKNTPLKDIRVRQALNYAVDRQSIAGKIYRGYAEAVGQNLTPGSLYWDPDLKPWPYDLALAKRLLAEAGYPNGFRLSNGFDFAPATVTPDVPLAIQGFLRDAGVEIEVVPSELAIFIDKINGRNGQQKGDLVFAGTGESTGFNIQYRNSNGCGKPAGAPPEAVYFCNPEWDRLFDQAVAERDSAKRAQIYKQMVRIERDNVTVIYTVLTPQFHASQPKLRGLQIPLGVYFNLDSVYKVK